MPLRINDKKRKKFGTILLLIVVLLVAIPTGRKYLERRALKMELAEADKRIAEYQAKNRELSKVVDYLQTPQAKEDLARQELGMKKAEEGVVVIKDRVNDVATTPAKKLSNPQKWFNYFFR